MVSVIRLYSSALLVFQALLPSTQINPAKKERVKKPACSRPAGYLTILPGDFNYYVETAAGSNDPETPISIFIPQVFPLVAPFLLGYLKKKGFSGCRVEVAEGGLTVTAIR